MLHYLKRSISKKIWTDSIQNAILPVTKIAQYKCKKDEPKTFKAFHNRALQELQINKLPGDCSKSALLIILGKN